MRKEFFIWIPGRWKSSVVSVAITVNIVRGIGLDIGTLGSQYRRTLILSYWGSNNTIGIGIVVFWHCPLWIQTTESYRGSHLCNVFECHWKYGDANRKNILQIHCYLRFIIFQIAAVQELSTPIHQNNISIVWSPRRHHQPSNQTTTSLSAA